MRHVHWMCPPHKVGLGNAARRRTIEPFPIEKVDDAWLLFYEIPLTSKQVSQLSLAYKNTLDAQLAFISEP